MIEISLRYWDGCRFRGYRQIRSRAEWTYSLHWPVLSEKIILGPSRRFGKIFPRRPDTRSFAPLDFRPPTLARSPSGLLADLRPEPRQAFVTVSADPGL